MPDTRVLITVFDALRPEFVTPELMPRLHAFCAAGARFSRSRSTFPTETRVNQSAVLTGCMPARHGVVANKFIAGDLLPGRLINSGDDAALAQAAEAGRVLAMPSIGERLAAAGLSFATLSAGTPGGGRLINLTAERDGSHRFAMRAPGRCAPAGFGDDLVAAVGTMPDYALPATDWIDWAVAAYLEHVEQAIAPDVMLLWLCEPDESFHYLGIGSAGARQTMQNSDAAFGRILDRLAPEIEDGAMHVIAMSDHGQLSLRGAPLDLPAQLGAAGIRASTSRMEGADCVVALHTAGGIWVRDRDAGLTARITEWLQEQPWCGPLFTAAPLAGTLPLADVRIDHPRAPDIAVVMRADDGVNEHGSAGLSTHDAPYPTGGGCHGGLSRHETHNVLALGGSQIRSGAVLDAPAGNIDVMPTVMALLGLPRPEGIDGRPLTEAMVTGDDAAPWRTHVLASAPQGDFRTFLEVTDLGESRYLDRAWVG